jgi:hypothetical protein
VQGEGAGGGQERMEKKREENMKRVVHKSDSRARRNPKWDILCTGCISSAIYLTFRKLYII